MKLIHMPDPDDVFFDFRTMAERVNARLKDEFGARFDRVRGAIEVKCHLMLGVAALGVDHILRRHAVPAHAPLEPRPLSTPMHAKLVALHRFARGS